MGRVQSPVLTNFTAEAIEEFLTGPVEPEPTQISLVASGPTGGADPAVAAAGPAEPPPAPAKTRRTKADPAPVVSQGEAPPLTMGS